MTAILAPEYRGKLLEPTTRQQYSPRDVARLLNSNRPVLLELEPGDSTCYTLVITEHYWRGAHSLLVVRLTGGHPKWCAWVNADQPGSHETIDLSPGDRYTADVLCWYLSLICEHLIHPPF
jgi:hypothetical protein